MGKAATFTKVDNVIQETKNLMNVISKVVTTCFECATKVNFCFLFYIRNLNRYLLILFKQYLNDIYTKKVFNTLL